LSGPPAVSHVGNMVHSRNADNPYNSRMRKGLWPLFPGNALASSHSNS